MLATPPGSPSSPSRRNLDYAFPPFAMGLPSVYERAGFDVNKSRSRSGSAGSSLRSRSSSRNSSRSHSLSSASQNMIFGGPINNSSSSSVNQKAPTNSNPLNSKAVGGSSASLDKPSPLVEEQFNKFKMERPVEEEPVEPIMNSGSRSAEHLDREGADSFVKEEPRKEVNNSLHTNNPYAPKGIQSQQEVNSEEQNDIRSGNLNDSYPVHDKPVQEEQFEISDEESVYSLPESIDSPPVPPSHTSPLRMAAVPKTNADADSITVDDSEFPSAIKPNMDFRFDDSDSEISIQEPLQDGLMHTPSNESTREDIQSVLPLHTNSPKDSKSALSTERQVEQEDLIKQDHESTKEPAQVSTHESAHEPTPGPIHVPIKGPMDSVTVARQDASSLTPSERNIPSKIPPPHLDIGTMRPMSPMNPMTPISPPAMPGMQPMSPRSQGMLPMSPRGPPHMSPRVAGPMPQAMPQHNFMPHNQPHLFNPQFAARPMPPPMNLPAMHMPHQPLHQPHTNNDEVFMQPKQRFPKGGSQSPKMGGNFSPSLSASKFNNPGMPGRNRAPPQMPIQAMPMPQYPGSVPQMQYMQAAPNGIPGMQGIPGAKRNNTRAAIGPAHQAGEQHMVPSAQRRMRMPPGAQEGPTPLRMTPGMPQGIHHGMPMPMPMPPGIPPGMPHGMPHGMQGMPQGNPVYHGMPLPQGVSHGMPYGMPLPQGVHNSPNIPGVPNASRQALSDPESPNTSSSPASSATSESDEDRQVKPNHPNLLTVADRRLSGSSSIYSARQSKIPPKHNTEHSGSSSSFDFNQPHLTATSEIEGTQRKSHRVSTWYSAEEGAQSREMHSGAEPIYSHPQNGFKTALTNESSSSQDLSLKSSSNLSQQDATKSKPRKQCRGCMLPISGKSVRAQEGMLSGRWHRDCFKCVRCDQSLAVKGEVHVLNDQPFCSGCYHIANNSTCRMCGEGIEGSCLETRLDSDGDQPLLYHVNCLRCAQCHMKLQHSYFDVGGQTYCAEHAFTSLPDDQAVHKRYTQFKMI